MAILLRQILYLKEKKLQKGFSLIEIMIVVAIIAVLILVGILAYQQSLLKGRDAKRKSDLAKWQRMLEDYINDSVCYPEGMACGSTAGKSFEGYLSEIPCDPINNIQYNYLYTYEEGSGCNKYFKVFARLESEKDPIITQLGCDSSEECPSGGCGPECHYNYWVGSPNVTEFAQLPDEFWPDIPDGNGGNGGLPTPSPGTTPTPSPGTTPTPSLAPSPSPGGSPPPETEPICLDDGVPYCIWDVCGSCCPSPNYLCDTGGTPEDPYDDRCVLDPECL